MSNPIDTTIINSTVISENHKGIRIYDNIIEELNIVKSSHTTFYTFTIQVRTRLSQTSSKR